MRLETGMDSENNLCGVDRPNNLEDVRYRHYVYFACLPYGQRHPTICTSDCPHMSGQYVRWYNGSLISCHLNGRTIPATTYPTTHLERNCVPSAASLYALVSTEIDESAFPSIIKGMYRASWLEALGCVGAALLAPLWITIMRKLTSHSLLAGMTVAVTVGSLLLLSCALWFQTSSASAVADADPVLQGSLQVETNSNMLVGLALFASIFAIGVIISLWSGLYARLVTAGGILREAMDALRAMPALILVLPPLLSLCVLAVFAYWLAVAMYIASAGTPHKGVVEYDETLRALIWLHTIGTLWTVEVLLHLGFCATAGLMVRWYFGAAQMEGGGAGGGGVAMLVASVGRTLRYSAGSLALGALLVIPGRLFRFFLEHCLHQAQTDASGKPELRGVAHCCLHCCLNTSTRYLQYISHNAYVLVAVHDVGFTEGARHAFELTLSNIGKVSLLTAGERLLLTLAKLSVAALCTAAVSAALASPDAAFGAVTNASGAVILAFVASFCVADAWFIVLDAAVESIFLCYLVDQAENDGVTRPYYASAALRSYMESNRPTYVLPACSLDEDELAAALHQYGGMDDIGESVDYLPPPPR